MSAGPGAAASVLRRTRAFATVAVLGFVVQAAVLTALTSGAGMAVAPATSIAVLLAVVHNFVWHERWTWADRDVSAPWPLRLLRFTAATGLVSLAGTVTLTAVYASIFGVPVVVGNLLAVWSVGIVNYLLLDRVVYQEAA